MPTEERDCFVDGADWFQTIRRRGSFQVLLNFLFSRLFQFWSQPFRKESPYCIGVYWPCFWCSHYWPLTFQGAWSLNTCWLPPQFRFFLPCWLFHYFTFIGFVKLFQICFVSFCQWLLRIFQLRFWLVLIRFTSKVLKSKDFCKLTPIFEYWMVRASCLFARDLFCRTVTLWGQIKRLALIRGSNTSKILSL